MKILRFSIQIWIVSVLLFIGGCAIDESSPQVNIITPTYLSQYSVNDTVFIKAQVSDETELIQIWCGLVDNNSTPVLPAKIITPTSNQYTLVAELVIDDVNIQSGNYRIKVQAYDKAGNSKSRYVQVYVNGIPRERTGVLLSTVSGSNGSLLKWNPDNTVSTIHNLISSDFLETTVSSLYQYANIVGENSAMRSFSLADNTEQWSIQHGPQGTSFSGMFLYKDVSYLFYRYQEKIVGYDHEMASMFSLLMPGYYVEKAIVLDNAIDQFMVMFRRPVSGNYKEIATYEKDDPGATYRDHDATSIDAVALCEYTEDSIFVFGNINGAGAIGIYRYKSGVGVMTDNWYPWLGGEIIDAVTITPGIYLVVASDKVYKYSMLYGATPHIDIAGIEKIVYDEFSNEVLASSSDAFMRFDYGLGQQYPGMIGSPVYVGGVIKDIDPVYNR